VLPIRDESASRLLASLFLSYVHNPDALLREFYRVLAPGGRLVVSSLRKDADLSNLFVQGVADLRERWDTDWPTRASGATFEDATRAYLNEASRLFDLEETGQFVFWDKVQLRTMLASAGFVDVECGEAFGDPPQATFASASRPKK
jgi:ubiquinone/menaquinone biosynthesis C-methylase UbiE